MAKEGNIIVDVGNSSIKTAKFVGANLVERNIRYTLQEVLDTYSSGNYDWIFSSVGSSIEEILALFGEFDPLLLKKETPLPISIDYDTPETLGMDRLAAAVGGHFLYPEKNVLIIDAGTCITYDIVTAKGVFLGGVISPGLKMRMSAMNHYTHQLPDISEEWEQVISRTPGKSTKECLLNGSVTAIIHEMNGFLTSFNKEYADLVVVLTGGDGPYFESNLKAPIFADLNLVLTGLNRILNYNR